MSDAIQEIFAKCLERMEAGESLESCLSDFPEQVAELEPLLRMTQQMKRLSEVGPRPSFARESRLLLKAQLAEPEESVTFKRLKRLIRRKPKFIVQRRFSMSIAQLVIAAVLVLTATTGGVAYAANDSNPGELLHGLDIAMENIQLNLAPDVASKVQLRLEFAEERLTEARETFSENDVADGQEAMNEYGEEISSIAQLIGSADGADHEALASLLETAQGVHTEVLTGLLDTVPDQAKESIQKVIDASSPSADQPEPAPGAPEDVGAPDNAGAPDGVGKPDDAGAPDGVGKPDNVGNPGVEISACTSSISEENAQALAELAKNHGVDYQYVLENFCTLGTLEQVEQMLTELNGPPANIPAGPPAEVPNGPPAGVPGGPPADTPGGQPSNIPGGPPINPPGKP